MEAWPGRGEGGVRAWPGIIGVAVATPATPVAPALLTTGIKQALRLE